MQKERFNFNCEQCGKIVKVILCELHKRRFCSWRCSAESRKRRVMTNCKFCKKEFETTRYRLKVGKAQHCSLECRQKSGWSDKQRVNHLKSIGKGKDSHHWKGGITPIRTKIWFSEEYQTWRNAVFARDGWACQMCGDSGNVYLHAHHLLSFKDYPEHRFNPDNGITLCRECHGIAHSILKRGDIFMPLPKQSFCSIGGA